MRLGVIGGSGVYGIKGANVIAEHDVETPFGSPSDKIFELQVTASHGLPAPVTILFMPRHGIGHRLLPTEVNYRANILALKNAGATHILAVSAVGILADGIHPGDLVVPDQLFDRTKGIRQSTFFGEGLVGHVSFGEPFCKPFSQLTLSSTRQVTHQSDDRTNCVDGGTYVCIEGPQFSTKAESLFYRQTLGASIIGMTAIPEAKLAREAGLHYAMLALATDYDCWNESEDEVSTDAVVAVVRKNAAKANEVVIDVARNLANLSHSQCRCAIGAKNAIMTDPSKVTEKTLLRLKSLL